MNSIRMPKQGKTKKSRRIAQAVDNEYWQIRRVAMKGLSTGYKLSTLRDYYNQQVHKRNHNTWLGLSAKPVDLDCDVCIRVDNYLGALCRGGQLEAGSNLKLAVTTDFKLKVLKK